MADEEFPPDRWDSVARASVHWWCDARGAWVRADRGTWAGWIAPTAAPVAFGAEWCPWSAVRDATAAPYVRWFVGARTNAAFNELDRHVLNGGAGAAALIAEPADGAPSATVSYGELLRTSVAAALALR